ncbi:MAG: phosphoribosyl-AMP cyclohydrolase, partial [Nitriliruptoraceae bacterium]
RTFAGVESPVRGGIVSARKLDDVLRRQLRFDDDGLVAAIVVQHDTDEVLMLAWMNADALAQTLECGETVFFSRSRQQLWHKGETSGNTQRLVEILVDCDGDALLVRVDQQGDGVACHTGTRSCFSRPLATAESSPTRGQGA